MKVAVLATSQLVTSIYENLLKKVNLVGVISTIEMADYSPEEKIQYLLDGGFLPTDAFIHTNGDMMWSPEFDSSIAVHAVEMGWTVEDSKGFIKEELESALEPLFINAELKAAYFSVINTHYKSVYGHANITGSVAVTSEVAPTQILDAQLESAINADLTADEFIGTDEWAGVEPNAEVVIETVPEVKQEDLEVEVPPMETEMPEEQAAPEVVPAADPVVETETAPEATEEPTEEETPIEATAEETIIEAESTPEVTEELNKGDLDVVADVETEATVEAEKEAIVEEAPLEVEAPVEAAQEILGENVIDEGWTAPVQEVAVPQAEPVATSQLSVEFVDDKNQDEFKNRATARPMANLKVVGDTIVKGEFATNKRVDKAKGVSGYKKTYKTKSDFAQQGDGFSMLPLEIDGVDVGKMTGIALPTRILHDGEKPYAGWAYLNVEGHSFKTGAHGKNLDSINARVMMVKLPDSGKMYPCPMPVAVSFEKHQAYYTPVLRLSTADDAIYYRPIVILASDTRGAVNQSNLGNKFIGYQRLDGRSYAIFVKV